MGFKRAEWHSGLTYRQACHNCGTTIEYTDEILDFRPWFADGFVYCPQCRTPLRHNEDYAVARQSSSMVKLVKEGTQMQMAGGDTSVGTAKFCNHCGHPFAITDRFCAQCGKKRENR